MPFFKTSDLCVSSRSHGVMPAVGRPPKQQMLVTPRCADVPVSWCLMLWFRCCRTMTSRAICRSCRFAVAVLVRASLLPRQYLMLCTCQALLERQTETVRTKPSFLSRCSACACIIGSACALADSRVLGRTRPPCAARAGTPHCAARVFRVLLMHIRAQMAFNPEKQAADEAAVHGRTKVRAHANGRLKRSCDGMLLCADSAHRRQRRARVPA